MLELRPGVTNELVRMVVETFPQQPWYNITYTLPPDPKERLEKMPWCFGIYNDEACIAAIWGADRINLIGDPTWKGRFLTKRLLRQFYKFFFEHYPIAIVEGADFVEMWKRIGFHQHGHELIAIAKDLAWLDLERP